MVFSELARGITERVKRLRNGDVSGLQSLRGSRHSYLGQSGTPSALAGDKRRTPRRTAVLRIVVGEEHSFFCNTVDVRRVESHQAHAVGADIRLPDIIAEDDKNIRLPRRCPSRQ